MKRDSFNQKKTFSSRYSEKRVYTPRRVKRKKPVFKPHWKSARIHCGEGKIVASAPCEEYPVDFGGKLQPLVLKNIRRHSMRQRNFVALKLVVAFRVTEFLPCWSKTQEDMAAVTKVSHKAATLQGLDNLVGNKSCYLGFTGQTVYFHLEISFFGWCCFNIYAGWNCMQMVETNISIW